MPKTKSQCEQVKLERRNAILKNALFLFSFKGYKNVTVDDICQSCECSHGLFYHYFKGKEDIFHSLMSEIVLPYIKDITSSYYNDDNSEDKLERIISNILDIMKEETKDHACIIFFTLTLHNRLENIPKPSSKEIKELKGQKHLFTIFDELIKKGQEEGKYLPGDSVQYAAIFAALIQGMALEKITKKDVKEFICPDKKILMRLVKKEEVN